MKNIYKVISKELVVQYYSCSVEADNEDEALQIANARWDWTKDEEDLIEIENRFVDKEETQEEANKKATQVIDWQIDMIKNVMSNFIN